ncbi:hypothetical protein PAMP_013453 [Pampus punctatissimus]
MKRNGKRGEQARGRKRQKKEIENRMSLLDLDEETYSSKAPTANVMKSELFAVFSLISISEVAKEHNEAFNATCKTAKAKTFGIVNSHSSKKQQAFKDKQLTMTNTNYRDEEERDV